MGLNVIFLTRVIHLTQNQFCALLVNSDLCFNDPVVDQTYECANILVILSGES